MKSINNYISEKLILKKRKNTYNIELLKKTVSNYYEAIEMLKEYFETDPLEKDETNGSIKKIWKMKKNSINNQIIIEEYIDVFEIGKYWLYVAKYDYGLVFKISENNDNENVEDICVSEHYLFNSNFYNWINKDVVKTNYPILYNLIIKGNI